ncbi:MAG: hypothetical protein E7184_02350 [Erysipelotrichaceae bacterium]|nr:hypothetical protein [Erysipelotrichaceae bacterium]
MYKYRGTNIEVKFPEEYVRKEKEFRGVWVTPICNDFTPSTNKEEMKSELNRIIKKMKEYHLNAIVFHIRNFNNAYYKTDKAPMDKSFGDFKTWDYLKWFIKECHKNNIEFHAWLNPYRIKNYGYPADVKEEDVAKEYQDYPLNPASNKDNILITYRNEESRGAILNPCKEEVRKHIIDVCMEVIRNYDIDAIHFDDYFYAQMSPNIDVLAEADQNDYEEYIKLNKNCIHKKDNVEDKKNWRRENVNKFIYDLHCEMKKFNDINKDGRYVQLGISPTGIYKNGDGSVENGSNTLGQEHYESYLFCDSMKWIDNEWIDYIVPQSYWGFSHPTAGFADVSTWWNKAMEGKKTKLYLGMGVYMSNNPKAYSWSEENNYEASNQLLFTSNLENVSGTCIFVFNNFYDLENKESCAYNGLKRIKDEYWTNEVKTPL